MSKITIRRRGKSWQYDVHHDEIGRKRKSGFRTRAAANQAAIEYLKNIEDKLTIDTSVTFSNYYKTWVSINKENSISKNQLQWYNRTLKLFTEKFGERKQLSTITKLDIQSLLNDYGEGRTRESVKKVKNCLTAPLRDAVYEGYIARDPTYRLQIVATEDTQKEEDKFLSIDEYLKLIEYFKSKSHKSYILLFTLAITGARFSEVNNMTMKDLNYKLDKIWLPGTKTKQSAREVSIGKDDLDYIRKAVKLHPQKINGKIFDISNRAALNTYRLALEQIGSKSETTIYALRHTHASFLIANQFDITYISKRLGHVDSNVTLKVYSHLLKEQKDKQDEKLAQIWHKNL